MSDKNLKDEQNTAEDAVIADSDLESVAGGVIDGCFPIDNGGCFPDPTGPFTVA